MPKNAKWERIEAALQGQPVDRVPFGFWMHFPQVDRDAAALARATIDLHQRYDQDYVKVMFRSSWILEDWGGTFGGFHPGRGYWLPASYPVQSPEDWRKLKPLDPTKGTLGEQLRLLRMVSGGLAGDAPNLATMFAPSMVAAQLSGQATFVRHLREAPEALHLGLKTIAQTLEAFARAVLANGADGVFYAIQQASRRVLTDAEYQSVGRAYDRPVLESFHGRSKLTMLHLHGEDLMFEELASYPAHVLNWYDRGDGPSLKEARGLTDKALAGGIDHERTLVLGTTDEVTVEVRNAIEQLGGRKLLLAPGCGVPLLATEMNLRAARTAVG
jgi:uroporphyrinogen decarboxylase